MHMLSEIHRTAEYGMFDYEQYFTLLVKAAQGGSWKAMFNLACALYKGKDAYDGCGFEVNKLEALKWSTHCVVMTMGLMDFYFKNPCSEDFKDYFQGVFALFIQSVCVSARQLILGDGVNQDLKWGPRYAHQCRQLLPRHFQGQLLRLLEVLLQHCEEKMNEKAE